MPSHPNGAILFQETKRKKVGKQLLSHRYNLLPLLCSQPGGVQRELIVKDLPATKVVKTQDLRNINKDILVFFFKMLHLNKLSDFEIPTIEFLYKIIS